jgi:hypothetical protein
MKCSKASVSYTDVAMDPSQRCEFCKHYDGLRVCAEVVGEISVAGWCELFKAQDYPSAWSGGAKP